MSRPDHRHALDFGRLDLAEPVDSTPLLFDSLKVCCKDCGRPLVEKTYEFFPSSLFIKGTCPQCGPRCAMFVPPIDETAEQKGLRYRAEAQASAEASQLPQHAINALVEDFLQFVAFREAEPTEPYCGGYAEDLKKREKAGAKVDAA